MRALLRIHLLLALAALAGAARAGTAIESFRYGDARAAAAAWRAVGQAPPVQLAKDGLVFRCPFDQGLDRVYWDRAIALDLSGYTSFTLDLTCENPSALRSLAVYFKSGDGWYIWGRPLREAGRQQLALHKQDFSIEGKPAGWDRIERIRLSPWKGAAQPTRLIAHGLSGARDALYVIPATLSAPDAADRALSARVSQRVSGWLRHAGIRHAMIGEQELLDKGLAGARVAILPYHPQPTAAVRDALRRFVQRGGRLIVCYSGDEGLAQLMGVKLGAYLQSREIGRWAGMAFDDPSAWDVPARVYQQSWNIRIAEPLPGRGQVMARWVDATGRSRGEPAWIATDAGFWMTHVLLDDDRAGKERLLLGLIGRFEPAAWADAADHAAATAGKIDDFNGLAATVAGVRSLARGQPSEAAVDALLQQAQDAHRAMLRRQAAREHPHVIAAADEVRALLTEAYNLAQCKQPGEFRGVWDHDGVGWYPGDWDRTCRELKAHGINAIFPNVLWSGLAHYPSEVVPGSFTLKHFGDQMKACLEAARRHGLQVHAWKVLWQVDNAPDDFLARLRKEGRLQQTADGKPVTWLNPALPVNVNYELKAIEELARTYPLDGIHLDYVRYPNPDACYGPASRRAFEGWLGRALAPWPASVRGGPGRADFRRWRAETITAFVKEARRRIRGANPKLRVSAAVWGGYPEVIESMGQDWGRWLRDGDVDFVCPMNYTEDAFKFSALLEKQLRLPGARGRVYPGLGVTSAESQLRPDEVIEQIATLRRLGAPGFVLFDLSQTLRNETLPVLGRGVTRDE